MAEYDASNKKDIRRAEKQAKIEETQRKEIVAGLMETVPGRAYVLQLLERCHLFATSFNPNPYIVAFNEGERNVGQQLLGDIMQACPDNYVLMMRERNEKELTNEQRAANDRRDSASDDGGDGTDDGDDEQ